MSDKPVNKVPSKAGYRPVTDATSITSVDGAPVDVPESMIPYTTATDYFHCICRRIIGDTVTKIPGSHIRPERLNEHSRWLVAVTRYRRTIRQMLESGRKLKANSVYLARLEKLLTCTPGGVVPALGCRPRQCGTSACCMFCYARSCAATHEQLTRCYRLRPTRMSRVYLVVKGLRPDGDHTELFRENHCAGGVICRLPVIQYPNGMMMGLTTRRVAGASLINPYRFSYALLDAIVNHMGYPPKLLRPEAIAANVSAAIDRPKGIRFFAGYGLSRASGCGHGPFALRYPPTRSSKPKRTHR